MKYTPRKYNDPIPANVKAEILRLYRKNEKIIYIAHRTGVSNSAVSKVANEAGERRRA